MTELFTNLLDWHIINDKYHYVNRDLPLFKVFGTVLTSTFY